MSKVLLHS